MFWKDIPHFDLKMFKNKQDCLIIRVVCVMLLHKAYREYQNLVSWSSLKYFSLNAFHISTNSIISALQNLDNVRILIQVMFVLFSFKIHGKLWLQWDISILLYMWCFVPTINMKISQTDHVCHSFLVIFFLFEEENGPTEV